MPRIVKKTPTENCFSFVVCLRVTLNIKVEEDMTKRTFEAPPVPPCSQSVDACLVHLSLRIFVRASVSMFSRAFLQFQPSFLQYCFAGFFPYSHCVCYRGFRGFFSQFYHFFKFFFLSVPVTLLSQVACQSVLLYFLHSEYLLYHFPSCNGACRAFCLLYFSRKQRKL